ncbi:efflux RND transporter periplasmic adaptor subunit [Sediminimonas qiaohouensis]|uniref:efflux RND transporter periplasmic adaptor subunit n=1 Tax=Sediminimonas qiaohouensis TaxID=552061 RepID=UPI000424A385|nr:efflux RND transporter periplasmic adaptor subunit [Sediminimonas qiaohouensis]
MKPMRLLRLLPPIAIGVGVAAWLIINSEPPERVEQAERGAVVTTLRAEAEPLAPVVQGFGNVRPARRWSSVSEVAGIVTYRHPDLDTGNVIDAGTHVLSIDPSSYELARAQAKADLAALRAEMDQLQVEEDNTARILELEKRRLSLARGDLERTRNLVEQGTAPKARADEQERAALGIERGVAELSNTLGLIPSRRARLQAQIARAKAALSRAERDLGKTRITAPFDLRVAEVSVQQFQFVPAGQPLVSGDGIARAEVTAQMPLDAFPRLMAGARADDGTGQDALERAAGRIDAKVTLVADPGQEWQGRVERIENALDPRARTVPVVVVVDAPYAGAAPPLRLPLVPNMYVRLTLTGPEGAPVIALPDHAVHGGDTVYLRDGDGRLELRKVTVAYRQQGLAVIAEGLEGGEEVVLEDLVPALPGMPLSVAEGAPDGATEGGQ